jgi:hypothetical protein
VVAGAQCDGQVKRRNLRWQQASAEEQRVVVPVDQMLVKDPIRYPMPRKCTYRALELGAFASSTFDNIVQADFCVANVLALRLARDRARCSIPTAVSIHAITVVVCETPMSTGSTALEA